MGHMLQENVNKTLNYSVHFAVMYMQIYYLVWNLLNFQMCQVFIEHPVEQTAVTTSIKCSWKVQLNKAFLYAPVQNNLIFYVCSRIVAMHMFCSIWSIGPPCGCRLRNLIWVYWIVLFAVRKSCEVNFVFWGTEGRLVSCVCFMRFITERTTLCLLLQFEIPSAALCELALVLLHCRTDQLSWTFLPVALRLWNLLLSDVLNRRTLSSLGVLWTCTYRGHSLIFSLSLF